MLIVIGAMLAAFITVICMEHSDADYEMTDEEINAEIGYLLEVKRRNQEARENQEHE